MILPNDIRNIITTNQSDDEINELIKVGYELVENYLDMSILNTPVVEIRSGTNTNEMILDNFPVVDITSIEVYNATSDSWDPTTFNFIVDKNVGIIYLLNYDVFINGNLNYRITYNKGYADTDVPEIINVVIKEIVVYFLNNGYTSRATVPLKSLKIGEVTENYGMSNSPAQVIASILSKLESRKNTISFGGSGIGI